MSEQNFKKGDEVKLVYQPPSGEAGLTDNVAEIVLPDGTKDVVNFPDVVLTEVDTPGVYEGAFTPDAVGDWKMVFHKFDGKGQVIKRVSVGEHNIHSIGGIVSAIATAVASIDTPPMCS